MWGEGARQKPRRLKPAQGSQIYVSDVRMGSRRRAEKKEAMKRGRSDQEAFRIMESYKS